MSVRRTRKFFQVEIIGIKTFTYTKTNPEIDLTPFTKINSKCIIDVNVKCKNYKTPRKNIGKNIGDLEFGDDFLDKTSKG